MAAPPTISIAYHKNHATITTDADIALMVAVLSRRHRLCEPWLGAVAWIMKRNQPVGSQACV